MAPSRKKRAVDSLPADVIDKIRTAISIGGSKVIREVSRQYGVDARTCRAIGRTLHRWPESRGGEEDGTSERILDVSAAGGVECWRDKFGAAREQALQEARAKHAAWLAERGLTSPPKLEIIPLTAAQQVAESRAWKVVNDQMRAAKKARRDAAKFGGEVT